MEVTKPNYYDAFRCIASQCPDSCCKEWDVQVDADSAAYYRSLPGALGDRLRQVLADEDGETVMTIVDGRCPMWRDDGLCRIQAELGEQALCSVCRDFPRLRHDFGDFIELGLELSCPEAARLILHCPDEEPITLHTIGIGDAGYDADAMASLKATRKTALKLLNSDEEPGQALAKLLMLGYQAQEELDGGECAEFHSENALRSAKSIAKPAKLSSFLEFFQNLEILTDAWQQLLLSPHTVQLPPQTTALARYLVQRYWLQAVSDFDLTSRVKFILIACILVGSLGGNYDETAQLFSKEIENDADNVDAILDAAYSSPVFTDDSLLGMVLNG